MNKFCELIDFYMPIWEKIGVRFVSFKDILGPHVLWRCKCSRKKFRSKK